MSGTPATAIAGSRSAALGPRPGSVEFWAKQMPRAIALVEGDRSFSYQQWNDAADRIAELLATRAHVNAGDRVAVCMHNRIEWFVGQAAIAKLDALLVPISYRLVPSEVQYIVADSQARALLLDAEDLDAFSSAWMGTGPASHLQLVLSVAPSERPEVRSLLQAMNEPVAPDQIARRYARRAPQSIVYTSGTTGRPRGVVAKPVTKPAKTTDDSASAQQKQAKAIRTAEGTPFARNLLGAPLTHAAGQASARSTHVLGGTVYVMPRFNAEAALRIIARERITLSFLVPTMLSRIVSLPEEVRTRHDVSSLQMITTGASPCPQDLKEQVIAYFGAHCLYESYGSTEVGVVARIGPADHLRKPGSCGQLIEGVRVRIVDEQGQDLPAGQAGELLVKTPFMIERYLNESTPADLRDGYFATGDIARIDDDGFLYIVDRKKDMIIAGGVNIYPAEIERVLRAHPAVLDAAVFGIPHPELGEQVKAAVELIEGRAVTEAELLAFVAPQLASYKRPRSIDLMSELPRNPAGKLLKAQLRAPYWRDMAKPI